MHCISNLILKDRLDDDALTQRLTRARLTAKIPHQEQNDKKRSPTPAQLSEHNLWNERPNRVSDLKEREVRAEP